MSPDLDQLARVVEQAAAAWPGVTVDRDRFAQRIAAFAHDLDRLHASDLYLATACVAGDTEALRLFDEVYLRPASASLLRFADHGDFRAEALQEVRVRLFAPGHPRIADYDGSGSLAGWVKVVAIRVALNLKKATSRYVPIGGIPEALLPEAVDPELELLKSRYRADFELALRQAFDALEPDARRILRFYLIDRLNIAEIGALVGISRATVGRRIVECRRTLLASTRERLREVLGGASTAEIDSVIRLINSRFDLTLTRVLRPE